MSFDNFSCKHNEDMDPNYIYPTPYIDPMMYVNPYYNQYQNDYNNSNCYMTYMNPYMSYPMMGNQNLMLDDECGLEDFEMDNMCMNHGMHSMHNMMGNFQMIPGMYPMNNMMYNPYMMMPGMYPMNGMMCNPYMMMPGMNSMNGMMPQIHLEEFDEEEM